MPATPSHGGIEGKRTVSGMLAIPSHGGIEGERTTYKRC